MANVQVVYGDIQLPDIGDPATEILSPAEEQQLGSRNPRADSQLPQRGQRRGNRYSISNHWAPGLLRRDWIPVSTSPFYVCGGSHIKRLCGTRRHRCGEHWPDTRYGAPRASSPESSLMKSPTSARGILPEPTPMPARSIPPLLLGVLATIAAGIVNPELLAPGLTSTIAAGTQASLAYSRSNEQEADRIGMLLLANADFDPMGMPDFFTQMHRHSQLNAGPVLEFLSTHPVTLSRISDTRNRAAQYSGPFIKDSTRFRYTKARIIAMTTNSETVIAQYETPTARSVRKRPIRMHICTP